MFCVCIGSKGTLSRRISSIIAAASLVHLLGVVFKEALALRLTNMTAPALQDPREDMHLHCQFDMGGEELYAVKWYKDDHEFFRYTPTGPKSITNYDVAGVQVAPKGTRCEPESCNLVLTQLSRPQSSGAYRCEVSSEAPAFRLASQTHNVTVAAVPNEKPKIEDLADTYFIGNYIKALCTSGEGDPKPALTWYINNQQVSGKGVREVPNIHPEPDPLQHRVRLKSTQLRLNYLLDKRLTEGRPRHTINITCVSSIDGINSQVAPPLQAQKSATIIDASLVVKNQKLHSPFGGAESTLQRHHKYLILLVFALWYC